MAVGAHDAWYTLSPIVLIVDDDVSTRRAIERVARSAGLDVESFSCAGAMMARTLPDRPACVVLELRLTDASGLDVQDALRHSRPDIPPIFVSASPDIASSVRALKAGAVDVLEKPCDDQPLLDAIDEALGRSRETRRIQAELGAIRTRFAVLTPRERDVLRLVIRGLLNKQIAAELGISEKTVKFHRGRVMEKTQVGSVAELVRQADRLPAIA
jgi:FixJ family two-component response regulator